LVVLLTSVLRAQSNDEFAERQLRESEHRLNQRLEVILLENIEDDQAEQQLYFFCFNLLTAV
jgi:hypothetical protein